MPYISLFAFNINFGKWLFAGSGKTLCYVLPILATISNPGEFISTLIVVPVQALVKQIINVRYSLYSCATVLHLSRKSVDSTVLELK